MKHIVIHNNRKILESENDLFKTIKLQIIICYYYIFFKVLL